MIYTLTINPALDYIIEIQNFKLSNINRSEKEYIFPGGKGINVSIVLKELGPFDKRESYANQKEFRFCFECNINIPYSLKIGNLEDIAQIVQAKPV